MQEASEGGGAQAGGNPPRKPKRLLKADVEAAFAADDEYWRMRALADGFTGRRYVLPKEGPAVRTDEYQAFLMQQAIEKTLKDMEAGVISKVQAYDEFQHELRWLTWQGGPLPIPSVNVAVLLQYKHEWVEKVLSTPAKFVDLRRKVFNKMLRLPFVNYLTRERMTDDTDINSPERIVLIEEPSEVAVSSSSSSRKGKGKY